MATVREIYSYVDRLAPFATQMDFDNAGFLVGRGERRADRVLVALDITEPVVREAEELEGLARKIRRKIEKKP